MSLQVQPAGTIIEDGMSDDEGLMQNSAQKADAFPPVKKRKLPGVVYISRIPPHLKPQKMRQLLEQHGEVARLYMAPEMPSLRAKRKKLKGNTGKNFTEGWVEFEDKRVAKSVAQMLNGQPMGGRRRSAYHYDLWCLKYLKKFQWESLTEEIVYQRALHDQKLAAEISTAKRDRDFYMSRIDKAKSITAIKDRRKQQQTAESANATTPLPGVASSDEAKALSNPQINRERGRGFGQRKAKKATAASDNQSLPASLLTLIAGSSA